MNITLSEDTGGDVLLAVIDRGHVLGVVARRKKGYCLVTTSDGAEWFCGGNGDTAEKLMARVKEKYGGAKMYALP